MSKGTFSDVATHIQRSTHEKGLEAVCRQRRFRSACAYAQTDQGLRCPLTESMDTVYVDEQRMCRSDCSDAHAHLDIRCLHLSLGPFSHVVHYCLFVCLC